MCTRNKGNAVYAFAARANGCCHVYLAFCDLEVPGGASLNVQMQHHRELMAYDRAHVWG